MGAAGAGALGLMLAQSAAAAPTSAQAALEQGAGSRGLAFRPIAPVAATVDAVTVPAGWTWSPIIRWGDPLFADSPAFDPNNQSVTSQASQFGYNNDYLAIIHTPGSGGRRGLLCANHEYTNENIMFAPTTDAAELAEQRRIAMMAHGFSVVELTRTAKGRPWTYDRGGRRNRRITASTPFVLDGPAAGHRLLRTAADPLGRRVLGTLNNCAGSTTPWGTILSGEENFNQYFIADQTPANVRYGIGTTSDRQWYTVDERFDARAGTGYENEVNRFGWVVEIDPDDPTSTPVKHTALGRFKHEAAAVRLTKDGRAAAYSGDDERFEYIYKFVSHKKFRPGGSAAAKRHNLTLLSDGDLYVAKFVGDSPPAQFTGDGELPLDDHFDGWGRWLPLVVNGRSMVPGMGVAEVLINTRQAADLKGPTKMDRPEDVQPNPVTGKVYAALTNNTKRTEVDEANPRITNRTGHVLELTEVGDDAGATAFRWNLLLVCGDPADPSIKTYFGGYEGPVSPISCPDSVAFDGTGTLWVSTDGQPGTIGLNDALHRVTLEGADRGKVEQFLAVPVEAETCGPVIDNQDSMVYVCVQHPGEDGTWEAPTSFFPDYKPQGSLRNGAWGGPRPSVIQAFRKIGS